MVFGKLVCGAWLIPLPMSLKHIKKLRIVSSRAHKFRSLCGWIRYQAPVKREATQQSSPNDQGLTDTLCSIQLQNISGTPPQPSSVLSEAMLSQSSESMRPISFYPALILGSAMVARGEIGFLLSAIAESNGILASSSSVMQPQSTNDETFLIVTWAIMLCTFLGPVSVGLLTRHTKRLENFGDSKRWDVLGAWGTQ